MTTWHTALTIRPDGALDFLSLGALVHRLDPGIVPFRKAHALRDPRERRRVQRRRQPRRLLPAADRHRDRDGRLPDRRSDRRARAGDGRHAVLQALHAQRRQRARTWPRSTATAATACARRSSSTTARTRPPRCSSRATSTGPRSSRGGVRWFHSGGIFASLSETTGELIIEGDEGREGRRRRHVVRPQLPREALEHLGRRSAAPSTSSAASSSTWTCSSATRRTCRRASASRARRSPPTSKLDPTRVLRDDRRRRRRSTRTSRSSRRRCARCTRPTATAGARWRG